MPPGKEISASRGFEGMWQGQIRACNFKSRQQQSPPTHLRLSLPQTALSPSWCQHLWVGALVRWQKCQKKNLNPWPQNGDTTHVPSFYRLDLSFFSLMDTWDFCLFVFVYLPFNVVKCLFLMLKSRTSHIGDLHSLPEPHCHSTVDTLV